MKVGPNADGMCSVTSKYHGEVHRITIEWTGKPDGAGMPPVDLKLSIDGALWKEDKVSPKSAEVIATTDALTDFSAIFTLKKPTKSKGGKGKGKASPEGKGYANQIQIHAYPPGGGEKIPHPAKDEPYYGILAPHASNLPTKLDLVFNSKEKSIGKNTITLTLPDGVESPGLNSGKPNNIEDSKSIEVRLKENVTAPQTIKLMLEDDKGGAPAEDSVVLLPVNVFLDNQNAAYNLVNEALGVSNYVTTDELLADSQFNDVSTDPENFRLQARMANTTTASIVMKLEVLRGTTVVSTQNYTLDKKDGDKLRGRFLRLVTDANDDAASGNGATSDPNSQTILVKLGDKLKASYNIAAGSKVEQEIQVGRPSSENNNDAEPRKHDIRELKVNIVVLKNSGGTGSVVSRATVDSDIETTNERLAQAGIKLKVLSINMGTKGVAFPAGNGADYSDGLDATPGPISTPTPDETALFTLKDADKDSIDIFYVDFATVTSGYFGVRGGQYRKGRNQTGNITNQNNIIISSKREVLTLPHEIMHVLLDLAHRNDAETALFRGGTSITKEVGGTKRIGPYPDAAIIGQNDVTTIRNTSEKLP